MNGPITLEQLDQRRNEILSAISTRGECWEIGDGQSDGFVLGPVDILGSVCGLIDEEYGWPISVSAQEPIESFAPRYRGHPIIVDNQQTLAMSVSMEEYHEIIRQQNEQRED